MKEIGAFEAKNKLAELLDLAEKGEEIIITRHGKQVARLGPVQKPFDREAARQADGGGQSAQARPDNDDPACLRHSCILGW